MRLCKHCFHWRGPLWGQLLLRRLCSPFPPRWDCAVRKGSHTPCPHDACACASPRVLAPARPTALDLLPRAPLHGDLSRAAVFALSRAQPCGRPLSPSLSLTGWNRDPSTSGCHWSPGSGPAWGPSPNPSCSSLHIPSSAFSPCDKCAVWTRSRSSGARALPRALPPGLLGCV